MIKHVPKKETRLTKALEGLKIARKNITRAQKELASAELKVKKAAGLRIPGSPKVWP